MTTRSSRTTNHSLNVYIQMDILNNSLRKPNRLSTRLCLKQKEMETEHILIIRQRSREQHCDQCRYSY